MEETKRGEEEQEMRWDVRILWPTSAIRYIEALGLVEKKMATHEGRGGMVDRLKNKNGILYDKRPRIPSSSNVFSVDFSFFFFFFPFLYLVVAYFLVFSLLFFFFLYFPRSILSPISRWSFSFLVSLMFRNPFFFPSLSLTLVASTCWRRARGEGRIDRPEGRFIRYCVVRTNDNCNSLLKSIALVFCPDDESLDRCVKLLVLILIARFLFHFDG